MLIDATHPEETRVAVVSGNKLEEYDFETVVRKQLKSNIYLVKVSRVEPSLQACFVDFGGNRHGFLPFPEIHPDYYRIPIADREALIAEERALAAEQAAREDAEDEAELAASGESLDDEPFEFVEDETGIESEIVDSEVIETGAGAEVEAEDESEDEEETENGGHIVAAAVETDVMVDDAIVDVTEVEVAEEAADEHDEDDAEEDHEAEAYTAEEHDHDHDDEHAEHKDEDVDIVGGDVVEPPVYRSSIKRKYKIQEVIKRNQIMLIQISKEERGNKGAAVTTYISLPGRYCVLMPNSPRGCGVSRKVSNAKDRQRLKKILHELNVPEGMSVILRTAGVARSTAEIKRDLDYLLRLWDQIRECTLKSSAPALIYEEGNLIKRSIRDLYKRDIEEVYVAGEEAYKGAREFMELLMPSHIDRVHLYNDETMPLFFRYQVESQIDAIHNPTVHLKSGGYIVINPTEALVSIDVNSGRATKGRHIEETALKTNLEAAEEIARQLRLRDQGGLVVIDFIDMEENRNNRALERKMRECMQSDRARIQIGRISAFGLLELSRQRLHPSLVETNFETCKHCAGTGLVRTIETTGVIVLRAIEEEGLRGRASELKVSVPTEVALYIFNNKREHLHNIEKRYNLRVRLEADDELIKPDYKIDILRAVGYVPAERSRGQVAPISSVDMSDLPPLEETDGITEDTAPEDSSSDDENGGNGRRSHRGRGDREGGSRDGGDGESRRRRGRRGGRNRGRRRGREGSHGRQNNNGGTEASQQEGGDSASGQVTESVRDHAPEERRVLPDPANAPQPETSTDQPQRKGWWKRLTDAS